MRTTPSLLPDTHYPKLEFILLQLSAVTARRQACYDGALGARALHSLQSYGQEASAYDGNAYTIILIYNDGTLKLYTSHSSEPTERGSEPKYYMNQLKAWAVTSDLEIFRQGATAYRNSRDWAKGEERRID